MGKSRTGLNWRQLSKLKHSSGRRWHRVGGRPAGAIPGGDVSCLASLRYQTRKLVLLCQLAERGEQLPRLELEARQLPQTRKDKFGWQFHGLEHVPPELNRRDSHGVLDRKFYRH